jgi:hypothetical protein
MAYSGALNQEAERFRIGILEIDVVFQVEQEASVLS